ncbi:Flagellar biosynthesis protein FlgN [Bordetella sputigena]
MTQMNATEKLLECLREEDAVVAEFAELLGSETVALTERQSFNALNEITVSKNGIAARLHELSERRDALLAELGFGPGHEGTTEAAARHPEIADTWRQLLDRCTAAAGINDRNGALIDMHLRYTEEALDALQSLTKRSSLYDPNGRSRQGNTGKTIVAT